jgi:hypothetical protein
VYYIYLSYDKVTWFNPVLSKRACYGTENQCNIPHFYIISRPFAALLHPEEKEWITLLPVHYSQHHTLYFTLFKLIYSIQTDHSI